MALTTAFRNLICTWLQAGTGTPYTAANAHIGVGDSNAVFGAGQTDLQASTNKLRKAMEATYPLLATNVITFRSLFGTSEANWAWEEWGIFNASSVGTMANRKVESLGTKTSAQSWQMTCDITITVS
jgi:hypothetical protein